MIVPNGYVALKEASRVLQSDYVYPDNTMPNGFDFEHSGWTDELWALVGRLPIEGVNPRGDKLDIPPGDRREAPWRGPTQDYSPLENEWLDLGEGRIKSGDYAGCMIVIPKAAWAAYLKERESGQARATGGRPRHPAYEWYKAKAFDRGGKTVKELQREMPVDANGNPPSATTIHKWENENSKKPPAQT
ncbi:hypothetical protein [Pseudoblastomonas halimionae]|uniref:Uncharacterized protein n=1 Tax=Alteriqipengyuania halimionae TaxID=1926630 RepID=A0A6I4U5S5_9SPHN|nr:hypothetical protein [Alteriqipengyuania halimionae]MXP09607.1 hypothetical protein [Alteriqipengyuania halimionae]